MKVSEEFKEGKHSIGYVSSSFLSKFKNETFEPVSGMPRSVKLPRDMVDAEIESELKPGTCTLGDVFALLQSTDPEYRDGNFNLFYTPSCVVHVFWYGDEWDVRGWDRGGFEWFAGRRVFSPAYDRPSAHSDTSGLTLESLDARLKKIEKFINPELLK